VHNALIEEKYIKYNAELQKKDVFSSLYNKENYPMKHNGLTFLSDIHRYIDNNSAIVLHCGENRRKIKLSD